MREDLSKLETVIETGSKAIKPDQTLVMNNIASQATDLSEQMKSQSDQQNRFSQQMAKTGSTIQSMEAQMHQYGQANTKISEQLASLVHGQSAQANRQERYSTCVQQRADELEASQSIALHKLSNVELSIDAVNNRLQEMKSATVLSASNPDILTKIVRAELRSSLRSALEEALSQSNMRHEATMNRVESMVDRMSLDLGQWATNINDASNLDHSRDTSLGLQDKNSYDSSLGQLDIISSSTKHNSTPSPSIWNTASHTTCTLRRNWTFEWRIGITSITVEQKVSRNWINDTRKTSFTILVHFRPSHILMALPTLSMHYSSAPDKRGFYQIAPMISIVPIIATDHPVWEVIENGDQWRLKEMISNGEVNPRSENVIGFNLAVVSRYPFPISSL